MVGVILGLHIGVTGIMFLGFEVLAGVCLTGVKRGDRFSVLCCCTGHCSIS